MLDWHLCIFQCKLFFILFNYYIVWYYFVAYITVSSCICISHPCLWVQPDRCHCSHSDPDLSLPSTSKQFRPVWSVPVPFSPFPHSSSEGGISYWGLSLLGRPPEQRASPPPLLADDVWSQSLELSRPTLKAYSRMRISPFWWKVTFLLKNHKNYNLTFLSISHVRHIDWQIPMRSKTT